MDSQQKQKIKLIAAVAMLVVAGALIFLFSRGGEEGSLDTAVETVTQQPSPAATLSPPPAVAPVAPPAPVPQPLPSPAGAVPTAALLPTKTGDPFGITEEFAAAGAARQRLLPVVDLFSPARWGRAERLAAQLAPSASAMLGMRAFPGARLSGVNLSPLTVASTPALPLPTLSPKGGYGYSAAPTNPYDLIRASAWSPSVSPPPIEGMRLAGIIRGDQGKGILPRAILEWRTPQGTFASQVVSPNEPLTWPGGGSMEILGSNYAIIKDAQGKSWRVPLRY